MLVYIFHFRYGQSKVLCDFYGEVVLKCIRKPFGFQHAEATCYIKYVLLLDIAESNYRQNNFLAREATIRNQRKAYISYCQGFLYSLHNGVNPGLGELDLLNAILARGFLTLSILDTTRMLILSKIKRKLAR